MPRAPRVNIGGEVYDVIDRVDSHRTIFHAKKEYSHFEDILTKEKELWGRPKRG